MNVILGDSNFFRHLESIPKHIQRRFNTFRVTTKSGLDNKVEASRKGLLAVANLNLVIDGEIRYTKEREARIEVAKCVTEEIILKLGVKAKTTATKIVVVPPLPLQNPTTYNEVHQDIIETMRGSRAKEAGHQDPARLPGGLA
jgi:hypothetical protein